MDDSHTTFDLYPRHILDIDGDGKADIISFYADGIYISYSNGKNPSGNPLDFDAKVKLISGFGTGNGYLDFSRYPRFAPHITSST